MAHPPRIPMLLSEDKVATYFVTFCVADRLRVLANAECFSAFKSAAATVQRWEILAAVIMPDHIHALVCPKEPERSVGEFSRLIKRGMRLELGVPWQWQAGCFDRLLRDDESAQSKWEYMRENPVRAKLVSDWQDWPFAIGIKEWSNNDSRTS